MDPTEDCIASLVRFPLTSFDLAWPANESPLTLNSSLPLISKISGLKSLALSYTPDSADPRDDCHLVRGSCLRHLAGLAQLSTISVQTDDCEWDAECFDALGGLSSLTNLHLNGARTGQSTDALLGRLKPLRLASFGIYSVTQLTHDGLAFLSGMPLQRLEVVNCERLDGRLFVHLTPLTKLRTLLVSLTCQLCHDHLAVAARLPVTDLSLHLTSLTAKSAIRALEAMASLRRLELPRGVGAADVAFLTSRGVCLGPLPRP